jgi:putative spermidine/putrescine transport system substrate-binding protein
MKKISRRDAMRLAPVLGASLWAGQSNTRSAFAAVAPATAPPLSPEETIKAAQAEGRLNVALAPTDWANYAEIIDVFSNTYNIPVKTIDLKGDSTNVLPLLRQTDAEDAAVDVIDVHLPVGVAAQKEGLLAAHKPIGWNKIPRQLKDAQGFWAGSHFGVLAFEVNKAAVKNLPQRWSDLLKPEYKAQFALAGDPRTSPLAMLTVLSAGLADGGLAGTGLRFFDKLNKAGALLSQFATSKTIASGQTPISFRWDYHALGNRDHLAGSTDIGVVIPQRGVVARTFVQGINQLTPHPYAARTWLNFLYSDAGQVLLLKGYARSAWFADLLRRNIIPSDLLAKLLAPSAYTRTFFPTPAQSNTAKSIIEAGWSAVYNPAP